MNFEGLKYTPLLRIMNIFRKIYNTIFNRSEIKHQIHCVENKIMFFRDMQECNFDSVNKKRLSIGLDSLKTKRELIQEQIKILDQLEDSILF